MNRILVIVVLVLIPVTIVTKKDEVESVAFSNTLENIHLEIPILQDQDLSYDNDNTTKVFVSNQANKSDAYAIDLEEYVVGVVAGEMPASFQMEALKAQAVAARTYALYKMKNIKNYVLSTNINDQVYLTKEQMKNKWGSEFDKYYERIKEAVDSTRGEVLYYQDDLIITYYFAISNGYTDDAQVVFNESRDYLKGVESSWDKNYASMRSVRTIKKSTFCSKLGISCEDIQISQVNRADNHYVRNITINNKTFTGSEVFHKLALKSMDFTITVSGEDVSILTLGFGHGVGMSQYGAQGMASEGYSYSDILTHYYQNTEISKI